jgi:hypothetical protein
MIHPHVRLEHRPVLPVEEIKREAEPPIRKLRTCSPQFSVCADVAGFSFSLRSSGADVAGFSFSLRSFGADVADFNFSAQSRRRCGRIQF